MAVNQGIVTGQVALALGAPANVRSGAQGDQIISELHGRYYEQAYRQQLFMGCNSAATTTSVALATTYTGLCLNNPAGNTKNLVLLKASVALAAAPAAIAPILLGTGYNAAGVATHTTPLVPFSTLIGTGPAPTGKLDAACTLPTAPVYTMPMVGGFTAAALPAVSPAVLDFEGSIILPPGAYAMILTVTATSLFAAMTWEETPV